MESKETNENSTTESIETEQKQPANKKKSKIFKTIKIIWKIIEKIIIIAIIFISAVIVTQRLTNNEKAFLGFRIFRVETGSMIPKYQVGDVILIKEKEIDKIAIGDDVTYNGTSGSMKGKIVTHQVVEIEKDDDGKTIFHTKGIANNLEDPVISGEQINGVVQSKLCILTAIVTLLNNKYIFYFCGIVPLTIFICFSFMKANLKKFEE